VEKISFTFEANFFACASSAFGCGTGLPDGIFSNKNPYLGKFWRVFQWNALVYFVAIWYIFNVLICCTKKNLATLLRNKKSLM
jgi:phosphotransferase system  glucose/maltose/N-acetylglucosamine-specific IIC component